MKNLKRVFVVLLVAVLSSCTITRGVVDFKAVGKTVVVENTSREELFDRANVWIVHTFKDPNGMVKWSNGEQGTIISKYPLVTTSSYSSYTTEVTLEIYIVDNKARIRIEPESITYTNNSYNDFADKAKNIDEYMIRIVESFEKWVKTKQL